MKSVDYIIVGFGLAGAALALQLRKMGRSVMIFDEPYEHQASRVAAGLFNPVTGKGMLKTWNAAELFPYLHKFYREAEEITGERFFYPMPICIPFVSAEEQNDWMTKDEHAYAESRYGEFINDPYGGLVLNDAGYLDTSKYLQATSKLFTIETGFDYNKHHDSAKAIIFCEGVRVSANSFFNWVPVKQLKGETLTITLDRTPPLIFNRGVYIVPAGSPSRSASAERGSPSRSASTERGSNSWRVGATYSHDTTPGVSETGRKELTEKLSSLLRISYTITNHTWGMRPTTPDRRPILGPHPEFKNVLIFNGMGTKGVSLAPWSSGILSGYLEEGRQIKNDINISRFYALYSKFRD